MSRQHWNGREYVDKPDPKVERVAKAMWLRNNQQWHSATDEQIEKWWLEVNWWTKELKWYAFAYAAIRELEKENV